MSAAHPLSPLSGERVRVRGGRERDGCHTGPRRMRRAQPWRTNRARVSRSKATPAEERLWTALRARRLRGIKFVRQCPIGPYFVDFACRELKIVVEVDGGTHSTEEEIARDTARSADLESRGYRIFRAQNQEVQDDLTGVLDTLLDFIDGKIA